MPASDDLLSSGSATGLPLGRGGASESSTDDPPSRSMPRGQTTGWPVMNSGQMVDRFDCKRDTAHRSRRPTIGLTWNWNQRVHPRGQGPASVFLLMKAIEELRKQVGHIRVYPATLFWIGPAKGTFFHTESATRQRRIPRTWLEARRVL
jgi:hypothetical protein